MLFNIPAAIWLGAVTIIFLFTTVSLGVSVHIFKKPVFKYHKAFAFLTATVAVVHAILAMLLWFFGVMI